MLLLALSGRARAGKDTVGGYLREKLSTMCGEEVHVVAFADEMKNELMAKFDLSFEQLHGHKKEVPDKRFRKITDKDEVVYWTPRQLMQAYGQFFRNIDYDYWTKKLFDFIEEKGYNDVIITDLRYLNEVNAVVERGGIHIRVVRPNHDNELSGKNHISETALDADNYTTHYVIENNGSLDDLLMKVDDAVAYIISKNKETLNHGI